MTLWQDMQTALDELARGGMLRRPTIVEAADGGCVSVNGRRCVCLCSNDYLGLSKDPRVVRAAAEALGQWGLGAGASRLVSGSTALHLELERRLADFFSYNHPAGALATSAGWMANHVAVHGLVGIGDMVLCDKLNHASLLDACLSSGARVRTYPHGDMDRLRRLLATHRADHRRCLIATDSLFSMDGDLAPLAEIAELKRAFDAQLLVDEAHALGVLGPGGRGAAEMLALGDAVDVTVGTMSKALGAVGGFVTGPQVYIDYLRNTARPYIYTTALPPALCAGAVAALEIVQLEPARREKLAELGAVLRRSLVARGAVVPPSARWQIVPLVIGPAASAVRVSAALLEAGFMVPAIRPPTVPRNTSRLRVSLCALHGVEDIEAFAAAYERAQLQL
jgi:8-amino-7-oxononanoate synthase